MPEWNDYKAEASARGALALELYVVFSTPTGDVEKLAATLPDHLAYQRKLEQNGHLVMAGPMSNEAGTHIEGAGLMVYRASSLDAARALAEDDPMHRQSARRFELRRWLVNEGALSLSVGLSTKSVELR
ncbi:YciI family protein [Thalassospira lucentensis]|uniref:YciI family protein n=1 Tax=Thalassospira lucentensis TaxID=168935 RepID=UPI003D2EBFAC